MTVLLGISFHVAIVVICTVLMVAQVINTSTRDDPEVITKPSAAAESGMQPEEPEEKAEKAEEPLEQLSEAEQTQRLLDKYREEAHASAIRKRAARKKVTKRKFMRVRYGMNMMTTKLKNENAGVGE